MSDQPNLEDMLNSIGAIAEILDEFHKQLLNRGFNEVNAMRLTSTFLNALIAQK